MSGAKLLDFVAVSGLENLDFPNLEKSIKQRLNDIKTFPDLEKFIKLMNPLLKAERFSPQEQSVLRRLRQRAYDRRRNPKFQIEIQTAPLLDPIEQVPSPVIKNSFPAKPLPEPGVVVPHAVAEKILPPEPKVESFSQGALRAITGINGEHFVKTAPKLLAWFFAAALVSFFLWQQSLALYETAGFTNAIYSAAGGILMIVGFAAYHSITRSWLALFFCIYAGAYEGYLMISGTVENEHQIQIQSIQISPDLVFLKEKAAKSLDHYHELKQRFDNPESKVFKNDWFLKTQLNPAWQESLADHSDLTTKEVALTAVSGSGHITWLKIFYRLGLVFLCMMLVHRFFAIWVGRHENRVYGN